MAQLSSSINMTAALAGQRADNGDVDVRSFNHAKVAQVTTVTVGGTATDGTYSIIVDDPRFGLVTSSFVRGAAEANAAIATALRAAVNDNQDMNNIAVASGAGLDVILTFLHVDTVFVVTESAPGPGTLTVVETLSSIVADLPLGISVKLAAGTDDDLDRLTGSDAVVDIIGLVERPIGALENTQDDGNTDTTTDTFPAGRMIPVGRRGRWRVEVEEAVTPASVVFVRFTATGAEVAGAFRASADGGDALDASSIYRYLSSAAAGGLAILEARIS